MPQIIFLYNIFAFASTSLHFSLAFVLDCFMAQQWILYSCYSTSQL
jgi:hypothetical protein